MRWLVCSYHNCGEGDNVIFCWVSSTCWSLEIHTQKWWTKYEHIIFIHISMPVEEFGDYCILERTSSSCNLNNKSYQTPSPLFICVCVRCLPAVCRAFWGNQLTGTLPTELGTITSLQHMCVCRGGVLLSTRATENRIQRAEPLSQYADRWLLRCAL